MADASRRVGPFHFYGFGGWQGMGTGHYNAQLMDQKLGSPDADAEYNPETSTWTRSFGSGASHATFDAVKNTGTVQWAT
jgi:hypothetical protein